MSAKKNDEPEQRYTRKELQRFRYVLEHAVSSSVRALKRFDREFGFGEYEKTTYAIVAVPKPVRPGVKMKPSRPRYYCGKLSIGGKGNGKDVWTGNKYDEQIAVFDDIAEARKIIAATAIPDDGYEDLEAVKYRRSDDEEEEEDELDEDGE
jgi:hypothetical protein